MSTRLFYLPLWACAFLASAFNCLAQSQPVKLTSTALDPTFGTGGQAVLNLLGASDVAFTLSVQPDLKVLIGGRSDIVDPETGGVRYGTVTRLNPDGTKDLGFSNFGVLAIREIEDFMSLKPLPDGSIVAAGLAWRGGEPGLAVTRLGQNGRVDQSFGFTYVDLRRGLDQPFAIAAQADGRILIAGDAGFSGADNQSDFGLVRLNPDGDPDPTFGLGGKLTTDFQTRPIGGDGARALALRPDGRIIAGGFAYNIVDGGRADKTFAIAQYDSTGNLDPSFGNGGRVTTAFGAPTSRAEVQDLTLQPDGKLLAVGFGGNDGRLILARYTTDGQLDSSFGQGGISSLQIGGGWGHFDAELLPDGTILVATAADSFLAALYSPDGQLIKAAQSASHARDIYYEIADSEITPDGKIIGAGRIAPQSTPPPGSEAWWNLNDVTVARSIEAQSIIPDPAATPLILATLALLTHRRRGTRCVRRVNGRKHVL
jgi:uncharacterized delta-60 repeat protein